MTIDKDFGFDLNELKDIHPDQGDAYLDSKNMSSNQLIRISNKIPLSEPAKFHLNHMGQRFVRKSDPKQATLTFGDLFMEYGRILCEVMETIVRDAYIVINMPGWKNGEPLEGLDEYNKAYFAWMNGERAIKPNTEDYFEV